MMNNKQKHSIKCYSHALPDGYISPTSRQERKKRLLFVGTAMCLGLGAVAMFSLTEHKTNGSSQQVQNTHQKSAALYGGDMKIVHAGFDDWVKSFMSNLSGGNTGDGEVGGNQPDVIGDADLSDYFERQEVFKRIEKTNDGFNYSFLDVVGKEIKDEEGNVAGELYDVLINKNTGKAQAIIMQDDGNTSAKDLKAISFNEILVQDTNGEVETTLDHGEIMEKPKFKYIKSDNPDMLSLRQLQKGQILDMDGNVAGDVHAVIYENAEARNIYFRLEPSLRPKGSTGMFGLPFEAVNIKMNKDGYDVLLTEEQTLALAKVTAYQAKQAEMTQDGKDADAASDTEPASGKSPDHAQPPTE